MPFQTCTGGQAQGQAKESHLKVKSVKDEGIISYPLSAELKNTETFERFQTRKKILDRWVVDAKSRALI